MDMESTGLVWLLEIPSTHCRVVFLLMSSVCQSGDKVLTSCPTSQLENGPMFNTARHWMPVNGGPTACVCFTLAAITTGWQYGREQLKARSGNPLQIPQDRGTDGSTPQIGREEEEVQTRRPRGRSKEGGSPGMDAPSQVGEQYKAIEACAAPLTSPGHFNPAALIFVTWDVLHKRPDGLHTVYSPPGSSQGHSHRMTGKSYCGVALGGGLKSAGHTTAREDTEAARNTAPTPFLPQPHMGSRLRTILEPSCPDGVN